MGSENTPVRTPEEDKKWKQGLGAVIKQLRNTNMGKDVGAIAASIAQYRRDFVGDQTKIIKLD